MTGKMPEHPFGPPVQSSAFEPTAAEALQHTRACIEYTVCAAGITAGFIALLSVSMSSSAQISGLSESPSHHEAPSLRSFSGRSWDKLAVDSLGIEASAATKLHTPESPAESNPAASRTKLR